MAPPPHEMYVRVAARYGAGLLPWTPVLFLGIVAAIVWATPALRERLARLPKARLASLGAITIAALLCAWRILWFADDAFISLHYARNWIEGRGLVYNPGEVVEGYTNFLWLALVAALGRLGADMPLATVALGLASYVGAIWLTHTVVRRLVSSHEVVFSFAAAMTAFSYPMVSFATGGLETMFCALLVLAAAYAAHRGRAFAAGVFAILATMGHPDHALFYIGIGAVLLSHAIRDRRAEPSLPWWRRGANRALARYAAPFVCIYLPYFVARWSYYGDLLPNTFYAKSGAGAYHAQGLRYLLLSFLVAGALTALPAIFLGLRATRRTTFGQIVLVCVPLYLFYVSRIGGDFMLARLLVSVLPLLFVAAELGVRSVRARTRLAAALTAPFVLACLPVSVLRPEETRWYLADERTYWVVDSLHPMTLRGATAHRTELLRKYFPSAGPSLSYAVYEIGYVAWRTKLRIIDFHGLIDRELARMPLTKRGRPGHEREAEPAHILSKGADLARIPLYPGPYDELTVLRLEGEPFFLARYNEALLAPLRGKPGVELPPDFPRYLDDYLARAAHLPPEQLAADLAFFDAYYFRTANDPARRAALLAIRHADPR